MWLDYGRIGVDLIGDVVNVEMPGSKGCQLTRIAAGITNGVNKK